MTTRSLAAAAALLLLQGNALAQAATASKPAETADAVLIREDVAWPRILQGALGLPSWLDLGIEQRTRFEYLDDPWRPGEPDSQTQFPLRTRIRIGVDTPSPFRVMAELSDARVYGDGPRDFIGNENDKFDVTQLFVAGSFRDLGEDSLRADLHLGRFSFDIGSRRLVARNSFRNTTNAFDGIHAQLGDGNKAWRVRGFWTRPVLLLPSGALDDESNHPQAFWGFAAEDKRREWLNLDAYFLHLRDRTGQRRYDSYGARALRAAKPDQLDYELELIGQSGERAGKDHSAFNGHAEIGYTLAARFTPRLVAQLDYASGTADPAGDESHTFDPLFGARRFDLNPTGIYGPFRRSNLLSPGVRIAVVPSATTKAQLKVRHWRLAQRKDAFTGTGLSDATGNAGRNLGNDVELSLQWTPKSWLLVDLGYDHWFKGSYLDDVASTPTSSDADYFYLATQLRF